MAVDTTAGGTEIIAASAGRQGILVTNQGTTNTCYVGTGTVSTANGLELLPGESVPIPSDSQVKAITATGSTTVGYMAYS